jgi:hypothetical protein
LKTLEQQLGAATATLRLRAFSLRQTCLSSLPETRYLLRNGSVPQRHQRRLGLQTVSRLCLLDHRLDEKGDAGRVVDGPAANENFASSGRKKGQSGTRLRSHHHEQAVCRGVARAVTLFEPGTRRLRSRMSYPWQRTRIRPDMVSQSL